MCSPRRSVPESLSRMPSNEQSLRHLVEAIEVGQSMQVGMNYAIVRFSDHGPGAAAEARSKIFERFYTADPSQCASEGRYGSRHGDRAVRGQGAPWFHLRFRQRRDGTDPDGGAAGGPGGTHVR